MNLLIFFPEIRVTLTNYLIFLHVTCTFKKLKRSLFAEIKVPFGLVPHHSRFLIIGTGADVVEAKL